MADSNIGALPQATDLNDDSLLVAEQQGKAVKITGAQFKEFGRQAVIGQVQGYVDQAEAAANRAADAVSAVTDMTVGASTLASGQDATVTKTTKNGKVDLAFGLPRGEQGIPGPAGEPGPRGPQGPTGKGLTILGYYDSPAALEAAVPSPEPGDAYGVGAAAPYDTYVFDGVTRTWKNNGPLSGGGGGPLPENVVTAEGGASMAFPVGLGDGPHVITFEEEEEPPLTAEDIAYSTTQNVKQAIDSLKASVSDGKSLIASAITDKGVDTAQDATFRQMADNIGQISGGSDTSDATATSFDILAGKTAYTANGKVEGVIPTLLGQTITPGTADKTIANGQYLGGTQVIKGDPALTSANIKKGVSLFGVEGALESSFKATLTVTADVGAVVTATHSGGTQVEALSTTGTVVLELPLEGKWTVTARRGVAQYNSVVIEVSSKYSAALTAEVHIEYLTAGTPLSYARFYPAVAAAGDYVIFAGGLGALSSGNGGYSVVEAYNSGLTQSTLDLLAVSRGDMGAASVSAYAIFAGGCSEYLKTAYPDVTAYSKDLEQTICTELSEARRGIATATIGSHALFAGGIAGSSAASGTSCALESYDKTLTHVVHGDLITVGLFVGGANEDHAIFCDGKLALAYNAEITMSLAPAPSSAPSSCARAGNYVVFCGNDDGFAYDAFLTRIPIGPLSYPRNAPAGTTLGNFAVFGGGSEPGSAYTALRTVDAYDSYLTHTTPEELSDRRSLLGAGSIGDYALFGGGRRSATSHSKVVDIYHNI